MSHKARQYPSNGIELLPQMMAQAPQQAAPVFNVGPLMLGDQLVAYVAANAPGDTPKEAVDWAMQVVSMALARTASGELERRVNAERAKIPELT